MISHKYAEFGSARVHIDLEENHGRTVSRCLDPERRRCGGGRGAGQGGVVELRPAEVGAPGHDHHAGLDGTCLLMCEDGWRETMVGTLGFYDRAGERQHTIYLAATPEYGKAKFLGRLEAEIERVKAKYPRGPLRGDRRRGEGELGLPGAAHRRAGDRLLACGGVPGQGGGRCCTGATPAPRRRGWRMRATA